MICMKKFALFLVCLALCFSFSACKEQKTADDKTPVVINMPTDDTVNGYRVSAKGSLGNTISAESVTVGDTDSSSEVSSGPGQSSDTKSDTKSSEKYCVNVKTGVFHKMSCSSVNKMKDENKAFFTDRDL